jgi:choline dehydrogenase-like flavoprotein
MLETAPALAAAIKRTTLDEIRSPRRYDAIVVGAGAAGGLAAALLTEAGLRVLVLDAGWRAPFWQVPFRRTVSTALASLANPQVLRMIPPALRWKGERALRLIGKVRQPVQSECYAWPSAAETFVDDRDCPYETAPDRPYNWIRARGLGGRMVVPLHGRQYYRHGPRDFRPVDELSPPWPFEPDALDPWYDLVEKKLQLSGREEHNYWIPDSRIAKVREPEPAEAALIARILTHHPKAQALLGRYAPPAATLLEAAATGRLFCRTGAIARHIELDKQGRAAGVVFLDRRSGALETARAPLIFLCASTLESTRILLASRCDRYPEGLGGASGSLGRHLMDHVSIKVEGIGPEIAPDRATAEQGRCLYLPRFDARATGDPGTARGYGVRIYHSPGPAGTSYFTAVADSEMLPRPENQARLSSRLDAWGLPTLHITCSHSAAELALVQQQAQALTELAELAEVKLQEQPGRPAIPGSSIHECGPARMGTDPGTSVLNPFNGCWDAKGLYVTDGASFPSLGLQNPTLTIMALTARACDHAVKHAT